MPLCNPHQKWVLVHVPADARAIPDRGRGSSGTWGPLETRETTRDAPVHPGMTPRDGLERPIGHRDRLALAIGATRTALLSGAGLRKR